MSSTYSNKRSSSPKPVPHIAGFSKSVPETPASTFQRPIFRTVPDSPKENPLLLDDHGLDLSILTHKLQLYQLELEEAELRRTHRKTVEDKQAAEVAAAARFRDELERRENTSQLIEMDVAGTRSRSGSIQKSEAGGPRSRSASLRKSQATDPRSRSSSIYTIETTVSRSRSTSTRKSEDGSPRKSLPPLPPVLKLPRTKRPEPLLLPDATVAPQEIRSAALPVSQMRTSTNMTEMKKHWRRTTIASGRHSSSKIILFSTTGKPEYCDFGVPPMPMLSASTSTATSPPSMSPLTPPPAGPTEDQIRRELETFALEEGPNIQLSRRSSVGSRKRMPIAFIPDPEDRQPEKSLPLLPPPPPPLPPAEVPSTFSELEDTSMSISASSALGRKKSFFSRFERKNDVDSLLDLYMTEEQLSDVKAQKKKDTRIKRQTFFKRLQSTDTLFHRTEKPG